MIIFTSIEDVDNIGSVRIDDLKNAREVLEALGLKLTAEIVKGMEIDVESSKGISWSKMQDFLDTLEIEAKKYCKTCKDTFEIMERILIQALEESKTRTRIEIQKRALNAPAVDPHIDVLNISLSSIHGQIQKTKGSEWTKSIALLLMFGHIVRWQVLEDFVEEWVDHWGKGLNKNLIRTGRELLLTVKYGIQTPEVSKADTKLYRNAIAHGHFKFIDEHHVEFWDRYKGKKLEIAPLTSGDLVELYQRTEIRLRTMEVIARVLRAWGRHPSDEATPI